MNTRFSDSAGDGGLLDEILEQVRHGYTPNLEQLIAQHPDEADEISQLMQVVRFVQAAEQSDAAATRDARVHIDSRRPMLGDFRIEREIARGGMGVVYEAVQQSLNRRVALKLLLPGVTLSEEARERFSREAHMAGELRHRHIVPVYAVGEEDGIPYYAMQYIEGCPLSGQIRERREAGATPDGGYCRRAAEWGRQAAEALAHAHGCGVIHRDVKPSNMLLDADDKIWLTDFGLARRKTNVTITMSGDVLGTVRYMSPEQARGGSAIDERTDVYSLGVSLYELVSLQPPFDGPDRESTLKKVLLDEPKRLRQIAGAVPRPLEIIIHKAMEKEPARRYSSAGLLAEDLRRYLADKPLLTRPPGAMAQFGRLVARHKLPFAGLVALFILISGFGIWMSVLYAEAEELRQTAEKRRIDAETAADKARRETRKAWRTLEFLEEMLGSVDPEIARGRDDTLLSAILESAAQRVNIELADEPEVQAAIREVIGTTYAGLARYEVGLPLLESALAFRREALGDHHRETLRTWTTLMDVYRRIGRLKEAEEACREIVEVMQRTRPEGDLELATTINNLAVVLCDLERFDEAIPMYRRAIEAFRQAEGPESRSALVTSYNLGRLLIALRRYSEAETRLQELVEISRRVLGDTDPVTMAAMSSLVTPLLESGRLGEAEALAREAVDLYRRVYTDEHPETLIAESSWAETLAAQDRWEEVEPIRRKCWETARRLLPPGHLHTAIYEASYGLCLVHLGRFEAAEERLLAARATHEEQLGRDSERTQRLLREVVTLYEAWGKPEKAAEVGALLSDEDADREQSSP